MEITSKSYLSQQSRLLCGLLRSRRGAAHLDHPRVGGEKISMSSTVFFWQGSPPHGRGKDAEFVVTVAGGGITPAWAGKSRTSTGSCHFWEDHPRMGGEKISTHCSQWSSVGSPPHGRGKGHAAFQLADAFGITPAWAGKSLCSAAGYAGQGDHPRVGGEKARAWIASARKLGSPPRGRGKAHMTETPEGFLRITPAWAGKSPASQPWSPPLWMMVIRPRP